MKRRRLFEWNDQAWLPEWLRAYETEYLEALFTRLGAYEAAAPLLARALSAAGSRRVHDLCSGAGGPILALLPRIEAELGHEIEVVVSDRHPNPRAFERLTALSGGRIRAAKAPVDVLDLPEPGEGVRTLFDALHHFEPEQVRSILAGAARANAPLAIFDGAHRSLPMVAGAVSIPLLVWGLTPWIRPLRWGRFVWTYAIPVAPLLIAWDGFVSHLRAHTAAELEGLCSGVEVAPGYRFEVGELPFGPGVITWVLGLPGVGRLEEAD